MTEETPQSGHDGPYPAPVDVRGFTVRFLEYDWSLNRAR